jgi:hypothetical protein
MNNDELGREQLGGRGENISKEEKEKGREEWGGRR